MLTNVEVKGLFETFNHSIDLKPENITLILGQNGLGKTLILKMINAFFCNDFHELYAFHFKEFILSFKNGDIISVEKIEKEEINGNRSLKLTHWKKQPKATKVKSECTIPISSFERSRGRGLREFHHSPRYRAIYHDLEMELRHLLPYPVERIDMDKWLDARRGTVMSTSELIECYKDYIPLEYFKALEEGLPDWLTKTTALFDPIFIETQRLLIKNQDRDYRASVIKYSQELVEIIKNQTVIATDLGSRLDKSFPNRVIKQITTRGNMSDDEIEDGLNLLKDKRDLLNKVGLLDTREEEDIQYHKYVDSTDRGGNRDVLKDVLQVYIHDSNEKLIVYDELAQKLKLLMDIINKRFLYKKLSISRQEGFIFTSTITDKLIPISGLSSGEQHELVLFYQLLFKTRENSILLIDEPEISLHVTWQNHFIDDLREVISLNRFPAIIATHSPDIINNNWDLTIQLKGV